MKDRLQAKPVILNVFTIYVQSYGKGMESGLTLDEIKEKLVKNTKKRTDKTENDKSVEKTDEQKETA